MSSPMHQIVDEETVALDVLDECGAITYWDLRLIGADGWMKALKLKKSVSLKELQKQGFTSNLPRTIDIVPSTDNSGENSLDVTVYFPKTMKEEDVASAQTSRMLSWIQDTILSKAESDGRWPYVFVKVDGKDTHV
jgi:hypothetical protein